LLLTKILALRSLVLIIVVDEQDRRIKIKLKFK
jgi:hypothetical protein